MVGWYHLLSGHEFEQTLGNGEGQGSLVFCSPCGHKESDTTEQPNNILKLYVIFSVIFKSPKNVLLHFHNLINRKEEKERK